MMETDIISGENVKPSSPTPHHLRTYELSMLDQIVPPMLVPIVLYFPNGYHSSETANLLKHSLSLILTRFYPLAGRVKNDALSIDCNDEGVPFVVAKINGHKLCDLLKNPDPELPRCLLPCEVTWATELAPGSSVAMIQVNHFDCGGIAIGTVFWHKVVDAVTIGNFLHSWAATARGSREAFCPNYIAQSLFPQKEEIQAQSGSLGAILRKGKSLMRRYVFDAPAISKLKARSRIDCPTRVEVVPALIWKCFKVASLVNNKPESLVTHAVNLRRRAQHAFPSDCFGNFPGLAAASSTNKNADNLGNLFKKMRDAVSKIDNDFVNRPLGDEGFSGYNENLGRIWSGIPEGADLLSFSSWCGFDLYKVDFGWGKPVSISRCDSGSDSESPFFNVVWLMDTRAGDGVEA
ncbi:Salutaridinol 7-O-acetyltransferase [Handroanthus impetiginosus]|uniref:Salutaridinol 7-O-acetyltransferase n=1 Tax=Handroanthus impetiginosus TaxID=429701 RepID=A0A2G9HBW8_9LAMI|nr:Salutaridinol 7-O-acetyltransferase [Handroanthus impetiginosus]